MTTSAEVAVVRSIAEASEQFIELASTLRSLPEVRMVSHPCWMRTEQRIAEDQYRVGQGSGFRIEWYSEAEFTDGTAISFGQELSWHDGEWAIDASVRAIDTEGEHVLLEFPRRHAIEPADLVAELRSQTELLQQQRDEALRLFRQR